MELKGAQEQDRRGHRSIRTQQIETRTEAKLLCALGLSSQMEHGGVTIEDVCVHPSKLAGPSSIFWELGVLLFRVLQLLDSMCAIFSCLPFHLGGFYPSVNS